MTTAADDVELRCVTGGGSGASEGAAWPPSKDDVGRGAEGEAADLAEASRAMVVWGAASRGCADKFLSPIETAAMLAAWAVEGKRQKRQKVASCDITYVHQQDAEFNMVIALQGKGGEVVTGCNFLYERASLGHATETMLLRCEGGEQLLQVEVQYTSDGIVANPAALDEAMGVIGQAHAQLPEGKILVVAMKLKGWGKEGHSYLHRTVLLFDTDEALYYDPTSLVRGEYIRVQCEGFLPYLEREMDEWNLRMRATKQVRPTRVGKDKARLMPACATCCRRLQWRPRLCRDWRGLCQSCGACRAWVPRCCRTWRGTGCRRFGTRRTGTASAARKVKAR
jgi:hypothetical protein